MGYYNKIVKQGIQNNISYQLKIDYNYEISDDIKLTLIDTEFDTIIGYIIYVSEEYDNTISAIEHINKIVEDWNPIYLRYLYINEEYRLNGFANLLFGYFVNIIVTDKPCILMKSSFNVNLNFGSQLNYKILPKFYEKFGFEQYKTTKWYLKNL